MKSEHVRWHLKFCKKKNGDGKQTVNKVVSQITEASKIKESVTETPTNNALKAAKIYPAVVPREDLPVNIFIKYKKQNGEYGYKCKVCDKRFQTKENIKNHRMIHTGEKPYSCDICNEGFQYSYQVLLHKQEIHDIQIYRCKECRKSKSLFL